ncbi:hypothetical protein BDN70DRAFT_921982 [Pholiota conissans]|uniref:C2H2-type domain-containing protein n=1 Tax=Pholiota conissans TaxID=109636 RepID=A0A9P5YZE9_9AGAR|nr:hypothetical protein BDN70DRAFT_921982 [Pholiota conissans]
MNTTHSFAHLNATIDGDLPNRDDREREYHAIFDLCINTDHSGPEIGSTSNGSGLFSSGVNNDYEYGHEPSIASTSSLQVRNAWAPLIAQHTGAFYQRFSSLSSSSSSTNGEGGIPFIIPSPANTLAASMCPSYTPTDDEIDGPQASTSSGGAIEGLCEKNTQKGWTSVDVANGQTQRERLFEQDEYGPESPIATSSLQGAHESCAPPSIYYTPAAVQYPSSASLIPSSSHAGHPFGFPSSGNTSEASSPSSEDDYSHSATDVETDAPAASSSSGQPVRQRRRRTHASTNGQQRQRRYPCEQGCKDFAAYTKGDLKRHYQSTAHKEKTYFCNIDECEKWFTRVDALKRHINKVHSDEKKEKKMGPRRTTKKQHRKYPY